MTARAGLCRPRDRRDGLHLVSADPGEGNAFRGFRAAMAEPAVCRECRDTISGAIWLLHRASYCGRCVQAHLKEHARARPLTECAHCRRPIIVVSRDGRVKHDVCSPGCREARRRNEREHEYPAQVCPQCGETFTPHRPKTFCTPRCRLRAHRAKAKKSDG